MKPKTKTTNIIHVIVYFRSNTMFGKFFVSFVARLHRIIHITLHFAHAISVIRTIQIEKSFRCCRQIHSVFDIDSDFRAPIPFQTTSFYITIFLFVNCICFFFISPHSEKFDSTKNAHIKYLHQTLTVNWNVLTFFTSINCPLDEQTFSTLSALSRILSFERE